MDGKLVENLDLGVEPEWWPEYDISIGAPLNSATNNIQALDADEDFVYRRNFSNGFVLVNPTNLTDGSAITATIVLRGPYRQAVVSGGGVVPANGLPTGTLSYQTVANVTLAPESAVVLLNN